jgi:hypothetical protein
MVPVSPWFSYPRKDRALKGQMAVGLSSKPSLSTSSEGCALTGYPGVNSRGAEVSHPATGQMEAVYHSRADFPYDRTYSITETGEAANNLPRDVPIPFAPGMHPGSTSSENGPSNTSDSWISAHGPRRSPRKRKATMNNTHFQCPWSADCSDVIKGDQGGWIAHAHKHILPGKKIRCPVPGCQYDMGMDVENIGRHIESVHLDIDKVCSHCGSATSRPDSHKRHLRSKKGQVCKESGARAICWDEYSFLQDGEFRGTSKRRKVMSVGVFLLTNHCLIPFVTDKALKRSNFWL